MPNQIRPLSIQGTFIERGLELCRDAGISQQSYYRWRKEYGGLELDHAKRMKELRIYCEMAKLGNQMEQANETGDSKKFDALFQRMYELGEKRGPEYAALIDGLQDIDPESEVGQEISSTLDALDSSCKTTFSNELWISMRPL